MEREYREAFFGDRRAFTIAELLVVIAIIGTLVAMLLPAIHSARESARKLQCLNNLKQIGLAFHAYHNTHEALPSGGWGWHWAGDADRGGGARQPGSWAFSILPQLELQNVFDLCGDGQPDIITAQQKANTAKATQTVVAIYICPSRRSAALYRQVVHAGIPGGHAHNADPVPTTNRSDYVVNGGDTKVFWNTGPNVVNGFAGQGFLNMAACNGVSHQRSAIKFAAIVDGLSQTYLVGEKYLNPSNYSTGLDIGDDHSCFIGDDYDTHAWTESPPLQDREGVADFFRFGSSHSSGFGAVLCDGSTRHIDYMIDASVHRYLGNRHDRRAIQLPQ